MKTKIVKALPNHILTTHSDKSLYIADYKKHNVGEVTIQGCEPKDIKSVHLSNSNQITVCFDGFKNNALPLENGDNNIQCECVLFPDRCNDEDWVLFIETKYAYNLKIAFAEVNDYPNGMINQIIETVEYFRNKKILNKNKKVHAIVSFPNLIADFNSTLFRKSDLSIESIMLKHKIVIRGINTAMIISEKRIKLK